MSAALVAGGVTTGGGATALILRKILRRRPGSWLHRLAHRARTKDFIRSSV
jgi:hypothetical protein